MKKLKKIFFALLCGCSLFLLSGCTLIAGGDDLLQTPKPAENFQILQQQLEQIMGDTMSYVSPQSGAYRNIVTFEDINGDGLDEAIAFLREGTAGKISVYAFEMQNDRYVSVGSIEGSGSTLGSLSFLKNGADGEKLMVLTWTLSGDVKQGLTVCGIQNGQLTDLLDATCTSYTVCDMDKDDTEELFTVSYEDGGRKTAQIYDYLDDKMQLLSQTDASQEVQTAANITKGNLNENGTLAVFVDNKFENDNGMQTDIYVLDDNKLKNIALSASTSTYRTVSLYYSTDVNDDGVIEVPQLHTMPGYQDSDSAEMQWTIDWHQYQMDGSMKLTQTTYDNQAEGWTLLMPEDWREAVTVETTSEAGVNRTEFLEYSRGRTGDTLMTIYAFTGEDRKENAQSSGLVYLGSSAETSYAAELGQSDSDLMLSSSRIKDLFAMTENEWK